MPKMKGLIFLSLAGLTGVSASGCGGSPPPHILTSLTVSPETLPLPSSGNSVQYTATAHWSSKPFTTPKYPARWVACNANDSNTTSAVTVTQNGLATCGQTASGTYTINAWTISAGAKNSECNVLTACGGGCTVRGTAALNCSPTVRPAG